MSKRLLQAPRLEGQVQFILAQAGVAPQHYTACLTWAFGSDAWEVPPADWPMRWNRLHPTAPHITGKDKFVEIVFVVGYLYAQQRQKEEVARN